MASKANKRRAGRSRAPARVEESGAGGHWAILTGWLAALAAVAIIFSPATGGSFLFDDFHLPFIERNAAAMPAKFWIGGVRPLLMATYWANYSIWGVHPVSYHVFNIVLHAISAVLVYLILKKLLVISGASFDLSWIAMFGAGIFLAHPLQTESVDYIAGRSELLCALFVLSAWLGFLNGLGQKTTPARAATILLCAAAAVLSKESGVCAAGLIVASDLYWSKESFASTFRKRLYLYVPGLVGLLVATGIILRTLSRSTTAGFAAGAPPLEYLITQCRAVWIYLRLFLIPAGQNADWQVPFYRSLGDGQAWVFAIGTLVLLAATAWLLFERARLVSFGLLVFLIALAPTSSIVPVQDAVAERRMYLPIVGLCIAIAGLIVHAGGKLRFSVKTVRIAGASILLILAVISWNRSIVWSSGTLLWADAVAKNPRNFRARSNLGSALMQSHDCAGAVREFTTVVDMQGMEEITGRNLGSAYECNHQPDLALATYRRIVAAHPVAAVWVRIGVLEALRSHADEALAAFGNALQIDPNNAPAYAFRGAAKLALKNATGAKEDFTHALAVDPGNAVARFGMAQVSANR